MKFDKKELQSITYELARLTKSLMDGLESGEEFDTEMAYNRTFAILMFTKAMSKTKSHYIKSGQNSITTGYAEKNKENFSSNPHPVYEWDEEEGDEPQMEDIAKIFMDFLKNREK